MNLSWSIPSARLSGEALALSELSGYEIYYVADIDGVADTVLTIAGATTTSYRVANLPAGTYNFAISAVDTSGVKSALSGVVTVTLGR